MGTPELTWDVAYYIIMAVMLPVLLVCGAVLNPSQKRDESAAIHSSAPFAPLILSTSHEL